MPAIVDTGPLVAFFDGAERHHGWPIRQIEEHVDALRRLMRKYRDTPMSLADACLVRMAELYERHAIMTLDSDFLIYRKHGRTPLALIQPDRLPS